jgi:putative addiction module CopG family antidote
MEIQLTRDREALIRQAVASGRYPNAQEAVRYAMARWEEGERARLELLAALDEADADLETGQGRRLYRQCPATVGGRVEARGANTAPSRSASNGPSALGRFG